MRQLPFMPALLLAALIPSTTSAEVVQAPEGDRGWYAMATSEQICVRSADEVAEDCWPSSGGTVSDLRQIGDGWAVAGHVAAHGQTEIFILQQTGTDLVSLPLPESSGALRGRPRLATDGNRLLGLVWLEGNTQPQLEVRAAEWLGTEWSPVTVVSPVGAGSQLAPAMTVLADGSWLLLWTAFDGEDDDTVWSRYDGNRWTPALPVHERNDTPDTTPTVLATRAGAIAAWSWLDGRDYRLRTAHFNGRTWRSVEHASGRGAVSPELQSSGGRLVVSYRTVVPEQWVFAELDGRGRELQRATIPSDSSYRPVVDISADGVVALWLSPYSGPIEATGVWRAHP